MGEKLGFNNIQKVYQYAIFPVKCEYFLAENSEKRRYLFIKHEIVI